MPVPPVSDRLPFPFFFLRLFPSTNTAFLSLPDTVIRIPSKSPSLPYLAMPTGYKNGAAAPPRSTSNHKSQLHRPVVATPEAPP
jgi:hypothetical protein